MIAATEKHAVPKETFVFPAAQEGEKPVKGKPRGIAKYYIREE